MGIFDDWSRPVGDPMDEEKRRLEEEEKRQRRASSIFADWGALDLPDAPALSTPAPIPEEPAPIGMPDPGMMDPGMGMPGFAGAPMEAPGYPTPDMALPGMAPAPPMPEEEPELDLAGTFIDAIAGQESGGDYNAVGPDTNSGENAQGKYQIMPSNWNAWSKEIFGEVVPQTPENQEAVATTKLTEYVEEFGPEAGAVAWYAGPGRARQYLENPDDPWFDRMHGPDKDQPSVRQYVNDVIGRMELAPVVRQPVQEQVQPDMSQMATPAPGMMQPPPMAADASSTAGLQDDQTRMLYLEQLIREAEGAGMVPGEQRTDMRDMAGQLPAPEQPFDPMFEALIQGPVRQDTGPVAPPRPGEAPQRRPDSIGPAAPFAIEDALAREEWLASLSGPQKAAAERRAQVTGGAGLANKVDRWLTRKVKGDEDYLEYIKAADEIAAETEGIWNKVGGIAGAVGGPVVDIMALHSVAGAAAPLFAQAGAVRTAKFLKTIAMDPTENWMAGDKIGALKSLFAEELPFIAADVLEGSDLKTIFNHAIQGVLMGGGMEAGIGRVLGRTAPNLPEPRARPDLPEWVRPNESGPIVRPAVGPEPTPGMAPEPVPAPDMDRRVADMGAPGGEERRGVLDRGRDVVAGGLERIGRTVETERRATARTAESRFGLQNRDAFDAAIPHIEADPERGIVYGDIAKLHSLNKPLGERAADDVLRELTEPLRQKYGAQVFKIGGDEIAVAGRVGDLEAISREMEELFPDRTVGDAIEPYRGGREIIAGNEEYLAHTTGIDTGYGGTLDEANRMALEKKAGRAGRGAVDVDEISRTADEATDAAVDRLGYDPEAPPDDLYGRDPFAPEASERNLDEEVNGWILNVMGDADGTLRNVAEDPSLVPADVIAEIERIVNLPLSVRIKEHSLGDPKVVGDLKEMVANYRVHLDDADLGRATADGVIRREFPEEFHPDENVTMPPWEDEIRTASRQQEDLFDERMRLDAEERAVSEAERRADWEVEPDEAVGAPVRAEGPERAPIDIEGFQDASTISRNMVRSDPTNPVAQRKAAESGILDGDEGTELRHTLGMHSLAEMSDDIAKTEMGKLFRSKVYSAGDVSKRVVQEKFDQDSFMKGNAFVANEYASRVANRIAKEHGADAMRELGGLPKDVSTSMQIAWGPRQGLGRAWSPDMPISKEMFQDIRELRIESDMLTSLLKKEDLVHGQLAASFNERGGAHLVRTYRQFDPADDWGPDETRYVGLLNWAQDVMGLDLTDARRFAGALRGSGDVGEAMNLITQYGKKQEWAALKRAQIRYGTSADAAGSTKVLTGFVPQNIRQEIEGLVKTGSRTMKAIDSFINRTADFNDPNGIIQQLERVRVQALQDIANPEYVGGKTAAQLQYEADKAADLIDQLWLRMEIPEPVRRFLGEEDNPLVRIMETLSRKTQILTGARVARKVLDVGLEKGTVKTIDQITLEGLDPKNFARIGSKDFKLAGVIPESMKDQDLWLDKDILEALNDRFINLRGKQGVFTNAFQGLNYFVKGNLTFRNPGTHGRNFFGAKLFESFTGLARPDNIKDQVARVRKAMGQAKLSTSFKAGELTKAELTEVRMLIEMGLIDKSVWERGFADNLQEMADLTDAGESWSSAYRKKHLGQGGWEKLKEWNAKSREVYRAEDDVARLTIYFGESDEMAKAVEKGVTIEQFNKVYGTDFNKESFDTRRLAANIANDTYPNYDKVSRGIQDLRRNPLLSSFPSFAAEVLRTSKNNMKFAFGELNTPGLRGRGIKRLYGMIQTAAIPPTLALGMAKLIGMSNEELSALRRDQGDYQKYNTIIPLYRNADGSINYLDMGYMEPHGLIRSVWNAFKDGLEREGHLEDSTRLGSAFWQAFSELKDPFAQQEILFGAFLEIAQNMDKWGQPVWDGDEWSKDMTRHLLKRFEPGISKPIRRTLAAARGEFATNLTRPKPWMEGLETIGFRVRQSNPRKEYDWRLGRTKDAIVRADDDLIKVIRDPNDVTYEELRERWEQFEQRRKRAFLDGGKATMDTRYRHNTENNIKKSIASIKISKEEQEMIRLGVYMPKEFGPTFQDSLMDDWLRQPLSKEDSDLLRQRVGQRVATLRQFSKEARAEGVQNYRWKR